MKKTKKPTRASKPILESDVNVKYKWFLPYRWNWKAAYLDIWNSKENRIFPPKQFGVGWTVNLHALWKSLKARKAAAKRKKSK